MKHSLRLRRSRFGISHPVRLATKAALRQFVLGPGDAVPANPHQGVEAMERRMLLSAYTLNQVGHFGTNATGMNPESTLVADSSGNLYGTATNGGAYGGGTVFEIAQGSGAITTLASFNGADGQTPYAGVALDPSGNLYGTTTAGGSFGLGTVFEVATGSNAITTLASFNGINGASAYGGVTLDAAGNLYGTTEQGGANNEGTVFEIASGSTAITTVASFNGANGASPYCPLTLDAAGTLYGTTVTGGAYSLGTVFKIASGSNTITTLASFNAPDPSNPGPGHPSGGVALDAAGNLYGTSPSEWTNGANDPAPGGAVFELARGSTAISTLVSISGGPQSGVIFDPAGNIYGTTEGGTVFEIAKGSRAATTLASFNSSNGASPRGGLMQDASGNLFGTTYAGGPSNEGVVFEIAKGTNTITALAAFAAPDGGRNPSGGLAMDASGNLFGTTYAGGASGDGTVFEIAKGSNTVTTIASFNGTNGSSPDGTVALDGSGNLYGTLSQGGGTGIQGTIFEIAAGSNTITTLALFNGTNGATPDTGLTSDTSGNLYGTTRSGGAGGYGTVFEIAAGSNMLTTLVSFTASTGYCGALTPDAAGNLYGTTYQGTIDNNGTVFEIAKGSNTLTTLASFNGANGQYPDSLRVDAAGNVYGSAAAGGATGDGTVFEIPKGSAGITVLASFDNVSGYRPFGLTLDLSGNLFGTTDGGGPTGDGTVFEIARGSSTIATLASFSTSGQYAGALTPDGIGNFYETTEYGGAGGYGSVFELTATSSVTLTQTSGANPADPDQSLGFTAAVGGGVPDGETVTLVDTSNNNAVLATGTLAGGSATLTVPAGTLSAGTHNLVAVYAGDGSFAASASAPYAQTVQVAVTGVVVNGNNAALVGAQRSMVDSILYTFSQAVTLAATNAFSIGVHAGQTGTVPTLAWAAINPDAAGASAQWVVTFSGAGVTGGSIADGVYDITLDPTKVIVEGNASATVASRPADTFYRLYGDVTGDGRVNNADYNLLLNSFNLKPGDAGYLAALDASGTGSRINNADYNLFLNNFNKRFTGFTATI